MKSFVQVSKKERQKTKRRVLGWAQASPVHDSPKDHIYISPTTWKLLNPELIEPAEALGEVPAQAEGKDIK